MYKRVFPAAVPDNTTITFQTLLLDAAACQPLTVLVYPFCFSFLIFTHELSAVLPLPPSAESCERDSCENCVESVQPARQHAPRSIFQF